MHRNLHLALALVGAALLAACGGGAGGDGVDEYLAQLPAGDRLARGGLASAGAGHWVDDQIGANGDPLGKISDFRAKVLAHCDDLDVALMKLCYVDSSYFSSHSAQSLLDAYDAMVDDVEAACPSVTLVHLTMPLEVSSGNAVREQYNALLRARYGSAVFDVALEESTRPDGSRSTAGGAPALYSGYAADAAGHLNAAGRARIAAKLIARLAATPP